jgi:hypothetical protein
MLDPDTLMRRKDDPGFIVAWKYKYQHEAGKLLDPVMTFGEAQQKAEELAAKEPDKVFWAEPKPSEFKPH